MAQSTFTTQVFGVVAEFSDADRVLAASNKAREAGYVNMDAYSPVPVHGLDEALGRKRTKLPWIVFAGGLIGCLAGFGLQVWVSAIEYPVNIGGRPLISWPSFIPVTFECTILGAALSTVIGMFALNGLPRPYQPIFNAANFERSAIDRFFLCIEAGDAKFDEAEVTTFLQGCNPDAVSTVTEEVLP